LRREIVRPITSTIADSTSAMRTVAITPGEVQPERRFARGGTSAGRTAVRSARSSIAASDCPCAEARGVRSREPGARERVVARTGGRERAEVVAGEPGRIHREQAIDAGGEARGILGLAERQAQHLAGVGVVGHPLARLARELQRPPEVAGLLALDQQRRERDLSVRRGRRHRHRRLALVERVVEPIEQAQHRARATARVRHGRCERGGLAIGGERVLVVRGAARLVAAIVGRGRLLAHAHEVRAEGRLRIVIGGLRPSGPR
jgi:hypothetical protein